MFMGAKMNNKLPKFERDTSYRRRGGSAQWLLLLCGVCKEEITLYQKDGPGKLLRLYLDRVANTDGERPYKNLPYKEIGALTCNACSSVIGVPMLYAKDEKPRTAIRLINAGVDQTKINQTSFGALPNIDPLITMRSINKNN